MHCKIMGLYDRHYMKKEQGVSRVPASGTRPQESKSNLTWWQRFRFKLWLMLKGRK